MIFRVVLAAALAASVASCGAPPKIGGSSDLVVTDMTTMPAPTRNDLQTETRDYLIGPFDKLQVEVFGLPEFTREVQADASGIVSIPLAGEIDAAGKTAGEVAKTIADRLRGRYVNDPQVTVNLKETVSQVVTVEGEVREPGQYPVVGRMTMMRAIATAKGTTEFAKLNSVVMFRTVNGQRMAALYNLKAIRQGAYPDPEVYANDVITVGDSEARRIFRDLVAVGPALLTPLVYILR